MIPLNARPEIADMTAQAVHAELVEDALSGVLTPLDRFVQGCDRIATLRGISANTAYVEVRDEVFSLGGVGVFMS